MIPNEVLDHASEIYDKEFSFWRSSGGRDPTTTVYRDRVFQGELLFEEYFKLRARAAILAAFRSVFE